MITYVRKGLTLSASRSPFNDPVFDKEGRCVLTVHPSFLLLNVYVPNASSAARREYKIKFLNALSVRMQKLREKHGKPVILAGDLNLHRRAVDLYPSFRMLRSTNFPAKYASEKRIRELLSTRKVVEKEVRTSKGVEKKFVITVETSTTRMQLGTPYTCKDTAGGAYGDFNLDNGFPGLCMSQYLECVAKLGIFIPPSERKRLEDTVAETRMSAEETRWFESTSNLMMDTFTFFHENAKGRYTCWNQYKNQRYVNAGARIDYILIDHAFFMAHKSEKSDPLCVVFERLSREYSVRVLQSLIATRMSLRSLVHTARNSNDSNTGTVLPKFSGRRVNKI